MSHFFMENSTFFQQLQQLDKIILGYISKKTPTFAIISPTTFQVQNIVDKNSIVAKYFL